MSTTRISGASTLRGLSFCHPSYSICRDRSPVAIDTSTASTTIKPQAGQTRLPRARRLEGDFEPVIGAQHLYRRPFASELLVPDAIFVQPLDFLLVGQRIVVKQRHPFGPRLTAKIDRDDVARMPPILL